MRKGTLVKITRPDVRANRSLTAEERNAWYENFRAEVQAGRQSPIDSAGEPRLAPQSTQIDLDPTAVYPVVRGRAAYHAPWGRSYHNQIVILDPKTGFEWYVWKFHVEAVK